MTKPMTYSNGKAYSSMVGRILTKIGEWRILIAERFKNAVIRDFHHVRESDGKACVTNGTCGCVRDELDTVAKLLNTSFEEYANMVAFGCYPGSIITDKRSGEKVELADEEVIGLIVGIIEGVRFARNIMEETFGTTLSRQTSDELSHKMVLDGCFKVLGSASAMYAHAIFDGDGGIVHAEEA